MIVIGLFVSRACSINENVAYHNLDPTTVRVSKIASAEKEGKWKTLLGLACSHPGNKNHPGNNKPYHCFSNRKIRGG